MHPNVKHAENNNGNSSNQNRKDAASINNIPGLHDRNASAATSVDGDDIHYTNAITTATTTNIVF